MKKLITMAFRQVRRIRDIYLPGDCSPMVANILENLQEILSEYHTDFILVEAEKGSFYVKFSNDGWIGVTTECDANEVLIKAALDRTTKFMKKHRQFEQQVEHLQEDIEAYFSTHGVAATVRTINLAVGSDSLTGKIQLSAKEGRKEAIKEHVHTFLEKMIPYFIKNDVIIIIEKQSLLDRITRDQLLRIIRRVERI